MKKDGCPAKKNSKRKVFAFSEKPKDFKPELNSQKSLDLEQRDQGDDSRHHPPRSLEQRIRTGLIGVLQQGQPNNQQHNDNVVQVCVQRQSRSIIYISIPKDSKIESYCSPAPNSEATASPSQS